MRNLKKVMALALATVMLLGIMVMGAGAADYTAYKDAASVDAKYELAVEMLKEIGVFEGDNNGNLNAKNTLTRAEAAKVIATLKLTKATASKIGAPIAAPFADVAADNWAAPYIAYAKDLGIISGVGDNKYDPAGTLTGYAFAKMLLVVLGYKADAEGYTGASWDTNVNLGALQANLLTGLNINLADAITREQAIQMAYNALLADMVYYTGGGTSIVLPDGTTINSSTGNRYPQGQTLMASLYGTTYTPGTSETAIGLPTTTWVKAGKAVAEAPAYTVVKTYAGDIAAVKASAIYADAGLTAAVNGVPVYANTTANQIGVANLTKDGAAIAAVKNYTGATMSLIKAGDEYAIIVEFATLAKVAKVNKATATAKANVELDLTYTVEVEGEEPEVKAFVIETEAYAKDDLLLVTFNKAGNKVLTHKKAALETGVISEITGKGEVVVNGTKYAFAGSAVGSAAAPATSALDGKTKFVYVIENGYIYANPDAPVTVTKASLEGVYYVDSFAAPTVDAWGKETYLVQLVAVATGDIVLEKVEAIDETLEGAFVTLKDEDKDKAYELAVFTEGYDSNGTKSIYVKDLVDTSIKTTTKAVEAQLVGTTGKVYFTTATKILTITGTKGTLAAKFVDVPADINAATATLAKVVYTTNKDGVREAALIIFKSAKALPANTVAPTSAAFYLLGTEKGFVLGGKDGKELLTKMDVLDLKTFEKTEVLVRSAEAAGFVNGIVKDGAYDFTVKTADTYKAVAKNATVSLYNGWLTIKGVAGAVDMETANTVVLNPNNTKDADGKVITTVAQLVKSGKATAAFDCELAQNTAKTAFTAVNYIIVK